MGSMFIKGTDPGLKAWHSRGSHQRGRFEYRGYTWSKLGNGTEFIYIPGDRPYVTQASLEQDTTPEHTASIRWVLTNVPGIEYVSYKTMAEWWGISKTNAIRHWSRTGQEKKNGGSVRRIIKPEDLGITSLYPLGNDRPWQGYPPFLKDEYRKLTPSQRLYVSWRSIWTTGELRDYMVKPPTENPLSAYTAAKYGC